MLATDVGPVIDAAARDALEAHIAQHAGGRGSSRHRVALPTGTRARHVRRAALVVLDRIDRADAGSLRPGRARRHWRADELDALIDAINATGYGLTLGIHSRIDATSTASSRACASATSTSTAT